MDVALDALRLHPQNTGFSWEPYVGPFRLVTQDQADAYNRDGYFLLEGAIDAATLDDVIAAIDVFDAETEAFLAAAGGTAFIARSNEITFSVHLAAKSDVLARFVRSQVFRDLGHDLLGPDVRLYWDQAVYKKPGTDDPFPWHQDNGYTFVEPQQYLTCWVALTDATEENGCPWVIPGVHLRGTLAHDLTPTGFVCVEGWPAEAVAVPARAGDIVVFSSLTPHATGPNRTADDVRKSYIVQLAPDGAAAVAPDGTRVPADDPARQPVLLSDGAEPA
jgi:ectoine hydroxylase-related dioxygenase (phytanoyl-CoA dioxygenase family)